MSDENQLEKLLTQILANEADPELVRIRRLMLERVALESDVKPSRIPAPLNITEIGGYINLLTKYELKGLRQQTIASILGLPMQTPTE